MGRDLIGAVLFRICHLDKGVCLGAVEGEGTKGLKVVDTFYLLKHRRSLNPSLVESFIPYLETLSPTYP